MKLSDYAKAKGVRHETAWRWFRDRQIKERRIGRTILVEEETGMQMVASQRVAVYARVSSTEKYVHLREPSPPIVLLRATN
jgi:putative resolvase